VLVSQRRDVLYVAGGDQLAGGAELVDDAAGVDVFLDDDRVDEDRQARAFRAICSSTSSNESAPRRACGRA
jgi:hypothetical protein